MGDEIQDHECAVCLQKCHHPTQLPCGHIFCFLCVKGVAIQSRKCAMCRAEIPPDYLDNPVLLEKLSPQQNTDETQCEYQWYYEGRNGWWKYDERSNEELETAYASGESECSLLLAGALYSIDFQNMTQVKCNDRSRRRKVRRDTPLLPAKGIAGIKTDNNIPTAIKTENDVNSNTRNNGQSVNAETSSHDDDDEDEDYDDVEIIEVEPVVIEIDDIADELERLNNLLMNSASSRTPLQWSSVYGNQPLLYEHSYTRSYKPYDHNYHRTQRPRRRASRRGRNYHKRGLNQ